MSLISTITQRAILARTPAGRVGQVSSDLGNRVQTFQSATGLQQISTITLTNWSDGRTYAATINGITITITTVTADADVTGAATRLKNAINADPRVAGQVRATSALGVVTLTSILPGLSFTLAGSTDAAAATSQSASAPSDIQIGRALLAASQGSISFDSYSQREANNLVQLALAANMTQRVVHVTPTAANSAQYGLVITLDDGTQHPFFIISGGAATVQEIVEAQVAAFPAALAGIITATEDNTKLILTGAAGRQFQVSTFGLGVQAIAVSVAGSDAQRLFAGISAIDDAMEVTSLDDNTLVYKGGHPVSVLVEGEILVENSEGVVPGDKVYMELASGADNGKLYKTPSATRCPIFRASWLRRASTSDDLAWVEIARR